MASPSLSSSRRGIAVVSTRPAPKPTASARSVAAPPGGGNRASAWARLPGDLVRAIGEADDARGRGAAFGGRGGQSGDGVAFGGERAFGEAVRDVGEHDHRDRARRAAQRRARQPDGDAGQHQRRARRPAGPAGAGESRPATRAASGRTAARPAPAAARPGGRTPAWRRPAAATRARSRRPPPVVADPLAEEQRRRQPERQRRQAHRAAPRGGIRGVRACDRRAPACARVPCPTRADRRRRRAARRPDRRRARRPRPACWRGAAGRRGASVGPSGGDRS